MWQVSQCFTLQMGQQDLLMWSHPQQLFTSKFCFLINAESPLPTLAGCMGRNLPSFWGMQEAQPLHVPPYNPTKHQQFPTTTSLKHLCPLSAILLSQGALNAVHSFCLAGYWGKTCLGPLCTPQQGAKRESLYTNRSN